MAQTAQQAEPAWVNAAQLAAHLGVSVRTIDRRCKAGTLPFAWANAAGKGGRRIFHLPTVEALLRGEPTAKPPKPKPVRLYVPKSFVKFRHKSLMR